MSDVVVTVPKNFRFGSAKPGLAAWLNEGDEPGSEWTGEAWFFNTWGWCPKIHRGERVYVVCNGQLVGYSPMLYLCFDGDRIGNGFPSKKQSSVDFVRGGGAVACTIAEPIIGFRGWRYRWWNQEDERPLDLSPYLTDEAQGRVKPLSPSPSSVKVERVLPAMRDWYEKNCR